MSMFSLCTFKAYMYLFPSHIFEEAAKPGRNCGKKHRRGFDHTAIFAPDRNVLDQNFFRIFL